MKGLLINTFVKLPTFMSRPLYDLARRHVFKDQREATWRKVFSHVVQSKITGDYLEFGVYRGTSFISAFKVAQEYGLGHLRFFAYDSFEGFPNDEGEIVRSGDLAVPEALFCRMIERAGVNRGRCVVTPGFYERSLTAEHKRTTGLTKAAVVHVDCDLYTSTKEVLHFIEDLVGVGTVIIFDDWYIFGGKPEDHGEGKAFAEWSLRQRFTEFFDGKQEGNSSSKAFVMTGRSSHD